MSTEAPLVERLNDWKERNPLRLWRNEQGLSLMQATSMIGLGMSTVQYYESGARTPSPETFVRLAELMGAEPDVLTRRWANWTSRRPKP